MGSGEYSLDRILRTKPAEDRLEPLGAGGAPHTWDEVALLNECGATRMA